jgi:glycosyltransferase involved in cell wall biosynthesis
MTLHEALELVPQALADLYHDDPVRWYAAILSHATQRQGKGAPRQPRDVIMPDALVIRSQQLAAWTGYGQLTIAFARELEKRGRAVRFCPDTIADHFISLPDWCQSRRCGRIPRNQPALAVGTPFWGMGWRGVQLTMWETTELPTEYVQNLNDRAGLIVPSDAVRHTFQASGVTVPIEVVPLGIDPEKFWPAPLPSGPFTVNSGGRVSHGGVRKGHGYLARCFQLAFPSRDDVRLVLKVWPDCTGEPAWDVPEDPRITIDSRILTDDNMADCYRASHVYATASKGEGWGLMPHQAAACGRAVIGCAFGSAGEIINHATGWPVPYRLEPVARGSPYHGVGQWACPDMAAMVAALRAAESDRAELARRSEAAARRATSLSWSHATDALISALTRFGIFTSSPATEDELAEALTCPRRQRPPGCGCVTCGGGPHDGQKVQLIDCVLCLRGAHAHG